MTNLATMVLAYTYTAMLLYGLGLGLPVVLAQSGDGSMAKGRAAAVQALWDQHVAAEFAEKSVDKTVSIFTSETTVNAIPTMTGGKGVEGLRQFYAQHFIPKMPADISTTPIDRTIGVDAQGRDKVVDEFVMSFTHNIDMDWMLPGIPPTGKTVRVPFVISVTFKDDKLVAERVYWDQATVLKQIGVLPGTVPAVTGPEQAAKAANHSAAPSNQLIPQACSSKECP